MCRKIPTPSDPKPASTSTAGACCLKLGLARRNVHLHVGIRWHLFTQVVRTRGGLGEWESGEKNASLCSLTFKKVVILVFSVRHCFSFLTLTFFFVVDVFAPKPSKLLAEPCSRTSRDDTAPFLIIRRTKRRRFFLVFFFPLPTTTWKLKTQNEL